MQYNINTRWSRLKQWPIFVRNIFFPRHVVDVRINKTNSIKNMCMMFFTEPIRRPWRCPNRQQQHILLRDNSVNVFLRCIDPVGTSVGKIKKKEIPENLQQSRSSRVSSL